MQMNNCVFRHKFLLVHCFVFKIILNFLLFFIWFILKAIICLTFQIIVLPLREISLRFFAINRNPFRFGTIVAGVFSQSEWQKQPCRPRNWMVRIALFVDVETTKTVDYY